MPSRRRFVIDTSLFTNPETQQVFGPDTRQAIHGFAEIVRDNDLDIYMPLSVFRELSGFVTADVLADLRRDVTVRAPDLYNVQLPAAVFHAFIGDLRERLNKGLDIAEKAIHRDALPENVRWVRERYREALRGGMVDSVEDFEVVAMGCEVAGAVVSEDRGIARMARTLGLEVFSGADFVHLHDRPSRGH